MNNIEFERLLNAHPRIMATMLPELCIRDIIYAHYSNLGFSEEKADARTKAYTDELFKMFVNREM